MRMFVSTGIGMLLTVAMFGAMDWATSCTACVSPADGGLGSSFLLLGTLMIPLGLLPAYLKHRRSMARVYIT